MINCSFSSDDSSQSRRAAVVSADPEIIGPFLPVYVAHVYVAPVYVALMLYQAREASYRDSLCEVHARSSHFEQVIGLLRGPHAQLVRGGKSLVRDGNSVGP
jgi:hypothetical protein